MPSSRLARLMMLCLVASVAAMAWKWAAKDARDAARIDVLDVGATSASAGSANATSADATRTVPASSTPSSEVAALGKQLFFDASLSASGKLSCASCHSPDHAYGPPNALAAQFGGPRLESQGRRAVPSLRYVLNHTPAWSNVKASSMTERLVDVDAAPAGGFAWDGRFDTLRDQAALPLLASDEMANESAADVIDKVRRAPYAARFEAVFGPGVFDNETTAFALLTYAIERFELEDPSFRPYSSKFDRYLDGRAELTASERRGKRLFDDENSGNCASCDIDQVGANGAHPLLTDFKFEALGVPRNAELRANANRDYYDMGLCGPKRTDRIDEPSECGLFKTPTLRNVATRAVFFHNGRFHTLKEALRFYVQRDTHPKKWYPKSARGEVEKFDDLPSGLRSNVDIVDEPLTRKQGGRPAWTERDIDDVEAFLETLTDDDAATVGAASTPSRPAPSPATTNASKPTRANTFKPG